MKRNANATTARMGLGVCDKCERESWTVSRVRLCSPTGKASRAILTLCATCRVNAGRLCFVDRLDKGTGVRSMESGTRFKVMKRRRKEKRDE